MANEKVASPELEAFIDEGIRRSKERDYTPIVFQNMRRHGTINAIEKLVRSGDIQSGFKRLKELGLIEWSIEAAVLKFPTEFSRDARQCAEWRLGQAGVLIKSGPENPPGFVVRTEAQKAAWDNGYRLEGEMQDGWLRYNSTTAPGSIWLGGGSASGPWYLSLDHSGVAVELTTLPQVAIPGAPGLATFAFANVRELHSALDRVYRLSVSLPDAPLFQFRAKTKNLRQSTEAERLVVQRVGQDIFRAALMDYWGGRCPLTGIAEPALLRASHIVPWSDCGDEQRLDVHNGLLLSALWDAAFDKGLVSFADDGAVLVSPSLSETARMALGVDRVPPLKGLRSNHRTNLAAHRARNGL